jgi:ECF transporter S component (folate family)
MANLPLNRRRRCLFIIMKTRTIAYAGFFIALSVILTRLFSAPIHIAGFYAIRLGLGSLPIILSGLILGPMAGAATGAIADIVGFVLFPVGAYFPGFTLSSALTGMIPPLVVRRTRNQLSYLSILFAIAVTDLLTSVILNTLWLALMSGQGVAVFFVPRLVTRTILVPIYSFFVLGIVRYYQALVARS